MNRTLRRGVIAALMAATALLIAVPVSGAHPDHQHQPKKGKGKKGKKPQKGKDSNSRPQSSAETRKVSIDFTALNGGRSVSCTEPISGLGTTSRTAKLADLRFYVSDVQLLKKGGGAVGVEPATGSKWSYAKGGAAVTLIDLENGRGACAAEGTKAMNGSVRGTVPAGAYTGIRYSVSVPDSLSHTDLTAMPSPLNITAMGWSWQFGRKFVKIEVSEDGGPRWDAKTFFVHLGATDCKGDPAAGEKARCALPNRDRITLKRFNPAKQRIALDFERLFGGVDVATNGDGMGPGGAMDGMDMSGTPGCMSETTDPDCSPIFEALGLKLGTAKTTAQTAFRVVGR